MKVCKFDSSKNCWHSSCSIFDRFSGMVSVCSLFRGGEMFAPRKVAPSVVSVFSKHGRVDRRGGGSC